MADAKPTLESLADAAIAAGDRPTLERIRAALRRHGRLRQPAGSMAPEPVAGPAPAAALGLASEAPDGARESALAIGLANRISQAIRRLEFRADRRARPHLPTLVAEGDSWFLHPLVTDTLDHLRRRRFNLRSLAAAGDEVSAMLAGTGYVEALAREGARAFLFSGGGNDLLGGGRIATVVRPFEAGAAPEALIDEGAFGMALGQVLGAYRGMLDTLSRELPGVRVFAHGYDHVVRIDAGPWIWPYLERQGYDRVGALAVVRVLLDRFNAALAGLAAEFPNFTALDLRGAVGAHPAAWHDAIHPRGAGFGKVADAFARAVGAFLATPPPRPLPAAAATPPGPSAMHEAVARGHYPRLTDFEAVRALVASLPPEGEWPGFADPQVAADIRDVVRLLGEAGQAEAPWRVANRLGMRPVAMAHGTAAEALFGASELEPVAILLAGHRAARAVGRVQIMSREGVHVGHGTGFLVAPGLFLTNAHVLPDAAAAARSWIVFDDETPLDGTLARPVRFRVSGALYAASADLDYAFVSVGAAEAGGRHLAEFGALPLIRPSGKAIRHEPVSIVQHPGGAPKAIAIRNSFVIGRAGDGLYYTTDTRGGSSGAPVLNREWQVVGLHHRTVPHPTLPGAVLANRGVRVSAILGDLEARAARGEAPAAQVLEALGALGAVPPADGDTPEPAAACRIASGAYAGLGPVDFHAAVAREAPPEAGDIPLPERLRGGSARIVTEAAGAEVEAEKALARIGAAGYRFIVAHEVSSRAHYEARLQAPVLPGGASGITIGIGYDLGQHGRDAFQADWGGLLPPETLGRLAACLGLSGPRAAAVLPGLADIRIPYDAARQVFERASLPVAYRRLVRALPEGALDSLPEPCVAALVSLVFNRGASFSRPGARYAEMRSIRAALAAGEPARVPGLLRAMTRLWAGRPGLAGVVRRREAEAALFEAGLEAAGAARPSARPPGGRATLAPFAAPLPPARLG